MPVNETTLDAEDGAETNEAVTTRSEIDTPVKNATDLADSEDSHRSHPVADRDSNATGETSMAEHVGRVAWLEKECNRLELDVLRHQVGADKGIPPGLLSGSTRDELETFANALLEFASSPRGPIIPSEGTAPTKASLHGDWLRTELSKK